MNIALKRLTRRAPEQPRLLLFTAAQFTLPSAHSPAVFFSRTAFPPCFDCGRVVAYKKLLEPGYHGSCLGVNALQGVYIGWWKSGSCYRLSEFGGRSHPRARQLYAVDQYCAMDSTSRSCGSSTNNTRYSDANTAVYICYTLERIRRCQD